MNKEKPKWSCLSAWAFCFSAAAEKVLSESRAHSNMVKEELRPLRLQRILLFISVIILLYFMAFIKQDKNEKVEKKTANLSCFFALGLKKPGVYDPQIRTDKQKCLQEHQSAFKAAFKDIFWILFWAEYT